MAVSKPSTKAGCLSVAVLVHYFTLSVATWVACQALHLTHQPLFTNRLKGGGGILADHKMNFVKRAAVFCHTWPAVEKL